MKKLVFGLAVCAGVLEMMCEDVIGMNGVEVLVSDLAKKPDDTGKLTGLVQELIDEGTGREKTNQAIGILNTIREKDHQNEMFEKICCMLWTISYHWEVGRRLVHNSAQYYVDGALNGEFGPYDF